MTIEIKQLVIRATVTARTPGDGDLSAHPAAPGAPGADVELRGSARLNLPDRLVRACVRQVLRELRAAGER